MGQQTYEAYELLLGLTSVVLVKQFFEFRNSKFEFEPANAPLHKLNVLRISTHFVDYLLSKN